MCQLAEVYARTNEIQVRERQPITSFYKGCCGEFSCQEDDQAEDDSTTWEDLLPELEDDDGEPLEPLPDFGDPPSWVDLDDWDDDE